MARLTARTPTGLREVQERVFGPRVEFARPSRGVWFEGVPHVAGQKVAAEDEHARVAQRGEHPTKTHQLIGHEARDRHLEHGHIGLGMACAQAASSAIQRASSSSTGAPCAAKTTGIRALGGLGVIWACVLMAARAVRCGVVLDRGLG